MDKLLGRSVMFVPHWNMSKDGVFLKKEDSAPQRGRIAYVNKPHGWFMIELDSNPTQRSCFKLCDIGKGVTLLGNKKNR